MSEEKNKRIGDYELLEHVGDGSQGRVYRARCLVDGKPGIPQGHIVAIKVVRKSGEDDKTDERFQREVKNLINLTHPNIMKYHEAFVIRDEWGENVNALVMEFLDGEDLKTHITRHKGSLTWEQIKAIFDQCLSALVYSSAQGIIHRDIKPSNIYVLKDGSVRIIDFGIARKEDGTVTTTAGFKGTYEYMAPDFIKTKGDFRGDEQSDIFSLGVCLFEALTGVTPFLSLKEQGWIGYLNRWQKDEGQTEAPLTNGKFKVLNDAAANCVRKSLHSERSKRYKTFSEMEKDFQEIHSRTLKTENNSFTFKDYLGKGGFGEVLLAVRESDNVEVAVKKLFPSHDPSRFVREARLLKRYPHPHIVSYIDFAKVERLGGDEYYIVMEYLEGMPDWTLRRRIKKEGAMQMREIIPLFKAYLHALEFLHTAQRKPILHRDLSPSNLYAPPLLHQNRHVPKIFDLGIAKSDKTMTGGRVPGNPEYMAPEFVMDHDFRGSVQSDLYSLGLCLYEAVTGKPGFPRLSKNTAEMWGAIQERADGRLDVSFSEPIFKLFPEMEALLKRVTNRDPAKRYSAAADMRNALESISENAAFQGDSEATTMEPEDVSATMAMPENAHAEAIKAVRKYNRRRTLVMAAAALLVISAGTGGWLYIRKLLAERPPRTTTIPPPRSAPAVTNNIVHITQVKTSAPPVEVPTPRPVSDLMVERIRAIPLEVSADGMTRSLDQIAGIVSELEAKQSTWPQEQALKAKDEVSLKYFSLARAAAKEAVRFYEEIDTSKGEAAGILVRKAVDSAPRAYRTGEMDKELDRIEQSKNKAEDIKSEVLVARASLKELASTLAENNLPAWEAGFTRWTSLKLKKKALDIVMTAEEWRTAGLVFDKSVSRFIPQTETKAALSSLSAMLQNQEVVAIAGTNTTKRLLAMLPAQEAIVTVRESLAGIQVDAASSDPATRASASARLETLKSAAVVQKNPALQSLWKKTSDICRTEDTRFAVAVQPVKTNRTPAATASIPHDNPVYRPATEKARADANAAKQDADKIRTLIDKRMPGAMEKVDASLAMAEQLRTAGTYEESETIFRKTAALYRDAAKKASVQLAVAIQNEMDTAENLLIAGKAQEAAISLHDKLVRTSQEALKTEPDLVDWKLIGDWVKRLRAKYPDLNAVSRTRMNILEREIQENLTCRGDWDKLCRDVAALASLEDKFDLVDKYIRVSYSSPYRVLAETMLQGIKNQRPQSSDSKR